ncbi:MAG: hypothetical protein R3236_02735, partial [Phycisphaeraceae bacterium]|nr:hypothetical protein [Phycisphaeraceae bacterium]
APAEVLAERIASDAGSEDQRPALTPLGGGLEEVSSTLALREPTYRTLADATYQTEGLHAGQVPEAAAELIRLAGLNPASSR